MTKQTPHTDTHAHAHTLPASREVMTARRPIGEGAGRGHCGPAPWRYVTGVGPWVRATSREAGWCERGAVQPGLHVRRAGWAAGSGSAAPAGQSQRGRRSVCLVREPRADEAGDGWEAGLAWLREGGAVGLQLFSPNAPQARLCARHGAGCFASAIHLLIMRQDGKKPGKFLGNGIGKLRQIGKWPSRLQPSGKFYLP